MARIRSIKPDFFTSEDIMALSPLARLLYIGLWCEADREGRMVWKPGTLKVRYLAGDTCDVMALAGELEGRGLIVLYGDGLACIPSFKDHQIVNPREKESKIPAPSESDLLRVTNASLTRRDPPSLPINSSLPVPVPDRSISVRPRVQGNGAFEPGSLPRDHKTHVLCGPRMQICLLPWQYEALETAYNDPDPTKARVVITQFVEVLETGMTAQNSKPKFSEVEKEFHRYLKTKGKVPPTISTAPPPIRIQELLDREAAKKAGVK